LTDRSPQYRPFLDIVRWIGAWLVLFGHARWLFFEGFDKVDQPSIFTQAFYVATGLQHEGVAMFFVVSGYLVGGSIWAALEADRFNGWQYIVKRFVRIYLVFVPALLLAWLLFTFGQYFLDGTRVIAQQPDQLWSIQMAVCHAANLQGVYCSVIVSNAPLWSLSYEWIIYLLAPLVLAICYTRLSLFWRITGLVLLASIIYSILPAHIQWYWFGYWAIGTVAWRIYTTRALPKGFGFAGLCVFIIACILSRAHIVPVYFTDLLIVVGLSAVIASRPFVYWKFCTNWLFSYLASFSYSLYLTHLPVITLTAGLIEIAGGSSTLSQPGFTTYALYSLTIGVAICVAALFARFTENHTRTVRKRLLDG